MLNRKTLEVGAVVLVGEIKSGLRGALAAVGFPEPNYLGVTPEPGSFLITGEVGIASGARLRIVELPRKRHGITTAVIEVLDGPRQGLQGHVYWCNLQASCDVDSGGTAKA